MLGKRMPCTQGENSTRVLHLAVTFNIPRRLLLLASLCRMIAHQSHTFCLAPSNHTSTVIART